MVRPQEPRFRARAVLGTVHADGSLEQTVLCGPDESDDPYWYPASAIKLCAAVAAIEWINTVNADASGGGAVSLDTEVRLGGRRSSIARMIRLLFVVSDNDAYNDLLDVCGRDFVNRRMRRLGLRSVAVNHKLGGSLRGGDAHNRAVPALEAGG